LLHVPENILYCGPSWTTWTFWMECYCGFLKRSLCSKKSPWANLNNIVLQHAYLEQLDAAFVSYESCQWALFHRVTI
ncbi:hypothetical protein B0H10DRAFT_1810366, partial [Mycena sp. CBHHK59/15]